MSLQIIARSLGDKEWLQYSEAEIEKNLKLLRVGQNYDPYLAIPMVLKEEMKRLMVGNEMVIKGDIRISVIRDALKKEFELPLKNPQIQEICQGLGFKVVSHSGYPKVKFDQKLLDELLKRQKPKI